jgi:hypothetical protein
MIGGFPVKGARLPRRCISRRKSGQIFSLVLVVQLSDLSHDAKARAV